MADVTSATGAPRADIIEGKLLYPFTAEMMGTASAYFRRKAIEEYTAIIAQQRAEKKLADAKVTQELIDTKTRKGDYNPVEASFIAEAWNIVNLPFLLWLSMIQGNKDLELSEVTALITLDNAQRILLGVMELMRLYRAAPPEDPAKKNRTSGPSTDSTGNPSDMTSPK
jgi:hypothetical protein